MLGTGAKIHIASTKQALVIVFFTLLTASKSYADLAGSAHDFTRFAGMTQNICIICHTPHNANTTVPNSPLWNHAVTSATFTPYQGTLHATPGQPTGISKLCYSCHDGTVAIDSYGGQVGTWYLADSLGTNLNNHHPLSFVYDSQLAVADGSLFDPDSHLTPLGGTIAQDLLRGGRMECVSCHDVHNRYNNPGLLRIRNTYSALCLTCHDM